MCTVNLLEGVFGQAGNTQETCSRNPAPVRKMTGLWVDLFLLKQHEKKENWSYVQGRPRPWRMPQQSREKKKRLNAGKPLSRNVPRIDARWNENKYIIVLF